MANYKEVGQRFKDLKIEMAELDAKRKELKAEFDNIRLSVIPDMMAEDGFDSLKVKGIGTIICTLDTYVGVKVEHREAFYEWLRDNDHGALITDYAHPATLKAFVKEQVANGDQDTLPEDLVSIEPFFRASIRK